MPDETKDLLVRLTLENKQLLKANQKTQKAFKETEKKASALKTGVGKLKAGYALLAGVMAGVVVKGFSAVIKKASDAQETVSKFNTVFKSVRKEADQVSANLSKNFGLSSVAAQKLLGDTGDLLSGFGFTGKAALDLAEQTNKLAVDLASFTNIEGGAERASKALTKALIGERESVKELGIAILEKDVVEQVALNRSKGLTFESERQARAIATLELATKQSKNAIGDFARTQDSLANSARVLKAGFDDLLVTLGTKFIPIATKITKALGGLIKSDDELTGSTETLITTYNTWQTALKKTADEIDGVSEEQQALNELQEASAKLAFFEQLESINKSYENQREEVGKLTKKSKEYADAVKEGEEALFEAEVRGKESVKVDVQRGIFIKELNTRTLSLNRAEKELAETKLAGIQAGTAAAKKNAEIEKSVSNLAQAQIALKDIDVLQLITNEQLKKAVEKRVEAIKAGTVATKNDTDANNENINSLKAQTTETEEQTKKKIELLKFLGQERLAELEAVEQKRLELISTNKEQEGIINSAAAAEKRRINQEAEEAIRAERLQTLTQGIQQAQQYANQVAGITESFLSNELEKQKNKDDAKIASEKKAVDETIKALKLQRDQGIITEEDFVRSKESLIDSLDDKEKQAQIREAKRQRKAAIASRVGALFDIAANTAVAISKAISSFPTTGGLPFSAINAALGVAQAAAVASKPLPQVPAFQAGGVISGLNNPIGREDGIIAAQNGESVLNRQATAVLGSDAINALNAGNNPVRANVTINVNDGRDAVEILDDYFKTRGTSERGLAL